MGLLLFAYEGLGFPALSVMGNLDYCPMERVEMYFTVFLVCLVHIYVLDMEKMVSLILENCLSSVHSHSRTVNLVNH